MLLKEKRKEFKPEGATDVENIFRFLTEEEREERRREWCRNHLNKRKESKNKSEHYKPETKGEEHENHSRP